MAQKPAAASKRGDGGASRRSREEGRWKKKSVERAPLDLTAKLSSSTKYTFEKPPKQARLRLH